MHQFLPCCVPPACRWVALLEEEYFQQGDREAAEGMPIKPLFDRSKQGISKSQVGFFNFVVSDRRAQERLGSCVQLLLLPHPTPPASRLWLHRISLCGPASGSCRLPPTNL